jgi:hypothetical protein
MWIALEVIGGAIAASTGLALIVAAVALWNTRDRNRPILAGWRRP